jgi:hypothetical protein
MQPVTATAHAVGHLAHGMDYLEPQYAIIQEANSGDNEIVAAEPGFYFKVLAYNFMSAAAVNSKFRSGTTDITGLSYMDAAGKGKVAPFNPVGWFKTAVNQALNLNLSGNVAVGGELVYVKVPA